MANNFTVKDLIDIMPDFNEDYDILKITKLSSPSTERSMIFSGHIDEINEELYTYKVVSITIDYDNDYNAFMRIYVLSPENEQ